MAEISSLLQAVQVGIESVPGTAVAANKRLGATSINPGIKVGINSFKPLGQKFKTINVMGKEWIEAPISGTLCYTDWVYLQACALAYNAPVQQGATTAYKWTATPGQSSEDTVKTLSVETGTGVRAHKFAYGIMNSIGYNITKDKAEIRGSLLGRRITDNITLTSSPTDIALQPVNPNDVSVFLDTTYAGLGTTKLLRCLAIDFSITDRFGTVWPIDSAQTSFAAHVETEPKTQFKLLMAADAQGMGLLDDMRVGAKKFCRVLGTGPVITNPYTYLFQHDICLEVADVSPWRDEGGIFAIEWTFDAIFDSGWGKAFSFETTNALAAL